MRREIVRVAEERGVRVQSGLPLPEQPLPEAFGKSLERISRSRDHLLPRVSQGRLFPKWDVKNDVLTPQSPNLYTGFPGWFQDDKLDLSPPGTPPYRPETWLWLRELGLIDLVWEAFFYPGKFWAFLTMEMEYDPEEGSFQDRPSLLKREFFEFCFKGTPSKMASLSPEAAEHAALSPESRKERVLQVRKKVTNYCLNLAEVAEQIPGCQVVGFWHDEPLVEFDPEKATSPKEVVEKRLNTIAWAQLHSEAGGPATIEKSVRFTASLG